MRRGGGGGDDYRPDDFTVDRNSVTFTATSNGPTPAPQVVNGSIVNVSSTVYLFVQSPGVAIAGANVNLTGPTTGQLTLFPKLPSTLGPGVFTESVVVRACLDQSCASQVRGSPKTISVTYNVNGIAAAPSSAALTAVEGVASAAATVNLNITSAAATWSSSISYGAGASGWLTVTPANGTSMTPSLSLVGAALSPGTYTATLSITSGAVVRAIPVTYVVSPNLSISPPLVGFSAVAGQPTLPSAVNVNVAAARASTTYTTSITYQAGATNWLSTTGNSAPGVLSVVPVTTNLPTTSSLFGANYSATVRLTHDVGSPVTFTVVYAIAPSMLTVSAVPAFTINAQSTASSSFTQRSLTTADSGATLNWTAVTSVPWLSVTPSGTSGQTVTVNLLVPQLAAIANGASWANITFTYSGPGFAGGTIIVPVTLNLNLPTVNYVAPYVGYTNEQIPVIVRGSGFAQSGGDALRFAATAGQNITVVSDTELRVTPPSIATPGEYAVSVPNSLGLIRTSPNFVVRNHPNYPYFSLTHASELGWQNLYVVHDAERDAVISAGPWYDSSSPSASIVTRYGYVAATGAWTHSSRLFPGLFEVALTPDGKHLVVLTTNYLHLVDPVTLNIVRSVTLPFQASGYASQLGAMNNGKILILSIGRTYSLVTDTFEPINLPTGGRTLAVSADGSRAVMGEATNSFNVPLSYYDSSTGTIQVTSVFYYFNGGRLSRDGSRLLSTGQLRDTNFNLIGNLDTQWSNQSIYYDTISPDGSRIYSHVWAGSAPSPVHVLDGTVVHDPLVELSLFSITENAGRSRPVITLDGRTLILIGEQKIIVQPLP